MSRLIAVRTGRGVNRHRKPRLSARDLCPIRFCRSGLTGRAVECGHDAGSPRRLDALECSALTRDHAKRNAVGRGCGLESGPNVIFGDGDRRAKGVRRREDLGHRGTE